MGDEVCALLTGGGYAEKVAVPAGQVLPVPKDLDVVTAAGLPETVCTVWSNVFMTAGLQPDETLLVHGGASGANPDGWSTVTARSSVRCQQIRLAHKKTYKTNSFADQN